MAIDPVSAIADTVNTIISRIFPDPTQAADAKLKLLEMQQNGELAQLAADKEIALGQIEINKVEAGSASKFVSWGRPFFIWVCGFAFAYHFIVQPMLAFLYANYSREQPILPDFDMESLWTLATGLLGLSSMRSFDKVVGTASSYTKGVKLPWRK